RAVGLEPVALPHALVPAADLVEVLLDLFGLFEAVVLAEVLELDLLLELGLALLDDLAVLAGTLVAKALTDARLVGRVQVRDREAHGLATEGRDPGHDALQLLAIAADVWQDADALLQVERAGP